MLADARSGLNVALLAFPQGMAYAVIADLPIQYGIVAGAIAAIVAPLVSGSRHTILGPTNATAFMLFSYFSAYPHADKLGVMPLLVAMVGVMLVVGAMLRIADLIQYISRSVVVGYMSGAAVLIIANQLRQVMGVELPEPVADLAADGHATHAARTFFTIVHDTLLQIGNTQWQPLVLAFATFVMWFVLGRYLNKLPVFAITLLTMTVLYDRLHAAGVMQVETFADFALADLKPSFPDWSVRAWFHEMSRLFGVAFSIAFLAALENSVMSKTLASHSGDRPRMNQDMFGVGIANLAVAFLGGMPASGSMTRSALNFASGAVSRLSSIFSGLLCVGGALLLGRFMHAVPKCCLAALVIGIAGSLINPRQIRIALRATRSDAAVLVATFLAALLLPLHVAIFLGIGVSVMLYLRKASRPHLTEYAFNEEGNLTEAAPGTNIGAAVETAKRPNPAISIVHVEGELFFGAAELFRTQIQLACSDPNLRIIVLRLKNARHLDATSVMALEELIISLRTSERDVIISGASREVYRVLRNSGVLEVLGRQNIFINSPKNPNMSTRKALIRAQELLGTDEADVRIFYDPSKDAKKK
jgi:SulP family sulfate permease